MQSAALVTKQEAAELLQRSERWIEQRAAELGARAIGAHPNGKPIVAYDVAALPAPAQLEWARRQKQKVVEIATPGQMALALSVPAGPNLSEADRAEAERRYAVIEPLVVPERYAALHALYPLKRDLVAFLAGQHKVAARTIYHWMQAWHHQGLPGLVTKDRADKGQPKALNAAAMDFLLAASLPRKGAYGDLTVREMHRAYGEEAGWRTAHAGKRLGQFERVKYARYVDADGRLSERALLPPVSYSCMKNWVNRVPEVMRVMAREGTEGYANTQEIISWREISAVDPLDYVVMDHRRLDLFALFPQRGGWKLARPWLTAAIDMRTRKWLGWVIVETPSSDSIAAVLKRVFLDFGIPSACYWDNGKDFRCEWLEGRREQVRQARLGELDTAWRGVLDTLGVRVHHAIVKRARAKLIEPNFGRTADFDRSTPWWCGHKPGARPERFGALLEQHERWLRGEGEPAFPTVHEIAALYDDAMETLNERPLEGEGMRKVTPSGHAWMCPNEAWELHSRRVPKRTVPAEVLQFAFAKRRTVTVQHGEARISFAGRPAHYRLVGNSNALMAYNGREVQVGYDPLDLGTVAIYIGTTLIGLAENVELRRMGEEAFVQDERDRRASRREVRRAIEAAHAAAWVPGVMERAERRRAIETRGEGDAETRRPEVPVALPAAVVEAARVAEEQRAVQFADGGEPIRRQEPEEVESEFQFFSR